MDQDMVGFKFSKSYEHVFFLVWSPMAGGFIL